MDNSPEILVIGAGLTGLILAHRLTKAGRSVLLVEARESMGGRFRRPGTPELYPAVEDVLDILEWAKSISPTSLSLKTVEHRPQLFDDGKLKPFAGFGETDFKSVDELSVFGAAEEYRVDPGLDQLVRVLIEQLPITARTLCEVTAFKIVNKRIEEVTLNGDKSIRPAQVIFTAHPPLINKLIPGEGLSDKNRTKLAKMLTWTSVNLELLSPQPLTNAPTTLIFKHNAKDFEPVVGRIEGERSIWMTLVPDELEADVEFAGQNIRQIKRQLKRNFSADKLGTEEKIYVHPHAYGQLSLKTKDKFRLPEIQNLVLAGHALGSQAGVLGAIEVARDVSASLIGQVSKGDVSGVGGRVADVKDISNGGAVVSGSDEVVSDAEAVVSGSGGVVSEAVDSESDIKIPAPLETEV